MKILIIDDNETHRMIHRAWCSAFEVIEADNAAEGFELVIKEAPDCVLLDFVMLGEDGFQLLHRMKKDISACPPIIMLTCALTEELKRNAMALGAAACFDKASLSGEVLLAAIRDAMGRA